uniref:SLC41A/MgtE integral membrane domain-containing protein n=1 Tax=Helicotheca tamesis TaxID=374047 RepID=A0A7S2DVS8_9STRA|mmetsp:Transcript_10250/g.14319  ORF Transcript_10250/g.14319 Transcript_10250/m.14319 type:complete len:335 (+) Transcript_10250:22-1026(+)
MTQTTGKRRHLQHRQQQLRIPPSCCIVLELLSFQFPGRSLAHFEIRKTIELSKGSSSNNNNHLQNRRIQEHRWTEYDTAKSGMKDNTNDNDSSASVLRELKETIKRQSEEIESLKKQIASSSSKKSSPTTAQQHHGHGPPPTDDDSGEEYINKRFYNLAIKRVGWLSLFLCSLSLTAFIMNGFEHTLSKQIELAYFVPLLAGHGGNTGGQTVGTVLTALSSKTIQPKKDALRVVSKEAMSGLTVGLLLASIVAPTAHYIMGISAHVSTVLFCTLPLLSTIAATLASAIPLLCVVLGLDPTVISAPAMTTFVDVSGLLSYFLIANTVFRLYGLEL